MRRITKTAVAVGAGGAVLIGGVAAAVPAFAGNGPGPGPGQATAADLAAGYRAGVPGMGNGICWDQTRYPAGTLTSAQKTVLASIAQQEKLSRDLYAAFAARYHIPVFTRMAMAETRHLDAIRAALAAYGVKDPTAGKAAGTFTSRTVQNSYNLLLKQGKANQDAALRAVRTAEQREITTLTQALKGLKAPRLQNIYTNLLNASRTHVATLNNWLSG